VEDMQIMNYVPPDPKEQLIDEFCAEGKLEDFRQTIREILAEIKKNGAVVSCKYNETASNVDQDRERPKHIRVSMIHVKTPLNIIWVMLHEYGHYLDWPRNADHSVVQREETAWLLAEIELFKYPQLIPEIESFRIHRAWCLDTYYKIYGCPQ
jgi:hypothetical protein